MLAEEKRQDSSVSFAARHAIGCPPGENGVNPLTIPTDESLSSFTGNAAIGSGGLAQSVKNTTSPKDRRTNCTTTHYVEGFAFMMLCQLRSQIRKIAISILKEARQILQIVGGNLRHGVIKSSFFCTFLTYVIVVFCDCFKLICSAYNSCEIFSFMTRR